MYLRKLRLPSVDILHVYCRRKENKMTIKNFRHKIINIVYFWCNFLRSSMTMRVGTLSQGATKTSMTSTLSTTIIFNVIWHPKENYVKKNKK